MSKVYLEDSVLTDIADAIREKTGGSGTITPANMSTEIESISGGGDPIELSQNIVSASGGFLERLIIDNQIECDGHTAAAITYMMQDINKALFTQSEYENLPQQLILKLSKKLHFLGESPSSTYWQVINATLFTKFYASASSSSYVWTSSPYIIESFDMGKFYILDDLSGKNLKFMFEGPLFIFNNASWGGKSEIVLRSYLTQTRPLIKNLDDENNTFENYIKELRSRITGSQGGSGGFGIILFAGQWYLNEIPGWYVEFLKLISDFASLNYSSSLNQMYYECYKIKTAYFPVMSYSSLGRSVKYTPRLRHIIFLPGQQSISNNSTLNLQGAGFKTSSATDRQDVCPDNKKIYDATTYEALKNDPDAWAGALEWSFYGHSAAAETLVSLPNQNPCPDGYNRPCTIAFDSNGGLNTDDGPISDLTAEEIAVATNKGWTVTLI